MKKAEMAALAEGLRKLSADIAQIADVLAGKEAPAAVPAEKETKTYTFEEVRALLADKARHGFRAEAKAILTSRGVRQLSEIKDPAELAAVAAEAEAIGNG